MAYFGKIGVPILGKLHMFVQHAANLCLASPAPSAALPLSRWFHSISSRVSARVPCSPAIPVQVNEFCCEHCSARSHHITVYHISHHIQFVVLVSSCFLIVWTDRVVKVRFKKTAPAPAHECTYYWAPKTPVQFPPVQFDLLWSLIECPSTIEPNSSIQIIQFHPPSVSNTKPTCIKAIKIEKSKTKHRPDRIHLLTQCPIPVCLKVIGSQIISYVTLVNFHEKLPCCLVNQLHSWKFGSGSTKLLRFNFSTRHVDPT